MQTGFSLLLREYVASAEVDYGDCEEFQITCPACHEAVFKAGKYNSDRQYFSHYAASKSDVSDCELRVAALLHDQTVRENLIGRGQTLVQFFGRFQDPLVTWLYSDKTPKWLDACDPPTMKKRLMWSCHRPEFVQYARHVRHHMRPENRTLAGSEIWQLFSEEFEPYRSRFWLRRQGIFAEEFLQHLLAPNSISSFAFTLAVALHCTLLADSPWRDAFLWSKNSKLRRTLIELDSQQFESAYPSEPLAKSALHMITALVAGTISQILLLLPYTSILSGNVGTRNRDVLFRWREDEMRRAAKEKWP